MTVCYGCFTIDQVVVTIAMLLGFFYIEDLLDLLCWIKMWSVRLRNRFINTSKQEHTFVTIAVCSAAGNNQTRQINYVFNQTRPNVGKILKEC